MYRLRHSSCSFAVLLGLVTAIALGCNSAGTTGGPSATAAVTSAPIASTPTSAPTAQPTATPSAVASPPANGVSKLCAVEFQGCTIEAGDYASTSFVPAFSFTIAATMSNDRDWPDGGGVSYPQGGLFWAAGMTSGMRDEKEVTFDSTIEGFAKYLKSFKGFSVVDGPPVSIDGTTATVLDVMTRETPARGIYAVKSDVFNLDPGEKARFFLLERDGKLVVFILDAFHEAEYDAVAAKLQPILDSVRWQ